jgi:hypothetical protein
LGMLSPQTRCPIVTRHSLLVTRFRLLVTLGTYQFFVIFAVLLLQDIQ